MSAFVAEAILAVLPARPRSRRPNEELRFGKALELAEEWWRKERLAESSIAAYLKNLRRLERELGGLMEPNMDTLKARLKAWRAREQRRLDAAPPKISASKVSSDRSALVSFYGALLRVRRIPENPALVVDSVPVQAGKPRPMPAADQERMLRLPDLATPEGLRDRAILECLRHGMRQGEVANLLVSGVSYDEREQAMFLEFRAKGRNRQRRTRDVPLEPTGAMIVARHLFRRFGHRTPHGADFNQCMASVARLLKRMRDREDPVFVTPTGLPLYQVWVNRMFNEYRDRAGVDTRFTAHTFRHRFCTALLEADVDLRIAMRLSGHSDPRSLLIYTQVARRKAVAGVNAAVERAPTGEDK